MNNDTKLFVFDRMEVFILFVVIAIVAILSFAAGVKIGQGFSYEAQGLSQGAQLEKDAIDFKSGLEEAVAEIEADQKEESPEELKGLSDEDLRQKFKQIEQKTLKPESNVAPTTQQNTKSQTLQAVTQEIDEAKEVVEELENKIYKGKWTIQLGSYQSVNDAKTFAEGFRARGYNPIINEVTLEGKGTWYRVGLGIFISVALAKEYIDQESTLFQGQEYTIVKLQ